MFTVLRILLIYLVVALVSGGIAYLGNQLGRHIGRRKMSVFNLRPRHTSIFITTLTGVLIALATLTLAILFSQDVRDAIRGRSERIEQLRERQEILRQKVRQQEEILGTGTVVWGFGQPILMVTLNPTLGPEATTEQIHTALRAANLETVSENNKIAGFRGETPIPTDSQLVVASAEEIQKLAEQLIEQNQVVGLRVRAAENSFYKKKVPVALEAFPVKRVFTKDEVILERWVAADDPKLLLQWYDFIAAMRQEALQGGMIQVGDSLGGGLTPEDFEKLVDQLSEHEGRVRLIAVAKRDLYQTSPLDVGLEVRK